MSTARTARTTRAGRQERGQEEILESAARLLAGSGYHGMSMRDLARATGMSLANLYNYFGAKEDLVYALQVRAFETLIGMAEEVVAEVRGGEARLHAFILSHVRYVASHRDVMRVLVEEAGELPPKRRRVVRELKERYYQLGHAIVGEVAGAGRSAAAARDGVELERVTYSLFGMLNWVYAWYDPARHGTPQAVARGIHRLALTGLQARAPSDSSLSDTERRVEKVRVRSPIRAHPGAGAA